MKHLYLLIFCLCSLATTAQINEKGEYLENIHHALRIKWPDNKTVNIVFHGHSVPSGYFNTPNVKTLQAYPQQVLQLMKEVYPYAVVNAITTGIGGENAEQGEKRFGKEVLSHHPDVLFIDYALNDRGIGLERAYRSWEKMIKEALKQNIKIILLTPTPDTTEDILTDDSPLGKHSRQIRQLARKFNIGLVDSYATFKQKKQNGEDLSFYMSQSNHPNEKGHRVVSELIAEFLLGKGEYKNHQLKNTLGIMEKTANRQIMTFENQVMKGSQWPNSHAYWAWTNATMYIGIAELAKLSNNSLYWDFLQTIGKKNDWKTGPSIYFADDLCIIQSYAQLYEKYKDIQMIEPSVTVLDNIIRNPKEVSLSYYAEGSHSRWCWCDALFMAPTAFARIGKATGEKKYYDFMDKEFWVTYDSLYCPQEKLFFRDTRYINMREKNGERVFWGRGNGWVIGALCIIIDQLPEDYPTRSRYIDLYKEMMQRVAGLQDSRGFWHPSMLDYDEYPMPETSASGFFTYGLLWGINRGFLDTPTYYQIAEKAWDALCSAVHSNGMLGYVQAIGADPKHVGYDDTEVYGTGSFLLAGKEMYKYLLSVNNK